MAIYGFSGSGGAGPVLQVATVTLTDAQIKDLPGNDFTLIAAPGAGKILIVESAFLVLDATAGAYTGVPSDDVMYLYTSGGEKLSSGVGFLSNFLGTTAARALSVFHPPVFSVFDTLAAVITAPDATDLASAITLVNQIKTNYNVAANQPNVPFSEWDRIQFWENQSLTLSVNSSVNYTGGNSANTLKVVVYYQLFDVP